MSYIFLPQQPSRNFLSFLILRELFPTAVDRREFYWTFFSQPRVNRTFYFGMLFFFHIYEWKWISNARFFTQIVDKNLYKSVVKWNHAHCSSMSIKAFLFWTFKIGFSHFFYLSLVFILSAQELSVFSSSLPAISPFFHVNFSIFFHSCV